VFALAYYLLGDRVAWYVDATVAIVLFVMGALLFYRHRENIVRLLKGQESRLGAKKAEPAAHPHPHSHHRHH
jgi:acyl phosphate:glycerol-3-phosphate acyltransferase